MGDEASGWYAHLKQWMIDPQQVMAATCLKCPEGSGQDAVSYFGAAAWLKDGDNWTCLSEDDSWTHIMKVADDGASFDTYDFPTLNDNGEPTTESINEQAKLHKVINDAYKLEDGDRTKRLPPLYLAGKKYTYVSWAMRDGDVRDCFFGQKDPKGGACVAVTPTGHIAISIFTEPDQNASDCRKCTVEFAQWLQTAA